MVVGSGFGGLAGAFELLVKGYSVKVLEAGEQPGGRARLFTKQGHQFDAGPTVITAPHLFDQLFALIGERRKDWVEFVEIDPFYRVIFPDGTEFEYTGNEERLIENIRKISPRDVDGYKKFAKHAERIFEVGYAKLADKPFGDIASMLRVVPDMVRLENYRSVYALTAKYIKDDRLRQAFSFEPLLVGGNPHTITSIYFLIHWLQRKWGVHFPIGGTSALVKAIVGVLEKHGVEFIYNCKINSLVVEKGKVKEALSSGGLRFPCDILVSNADPVKVYGEWIDPKWVTKNRKTRLQSKTQSMSLFVCYFGVKKKFNGIAHHTILLGPRYKGLLNDIFRHKKLADDFSLYLHAPTVTDPTLAPEGCETFYVLSPVPNNRSGVDWQNQKPIYQEKILTALEKRLLPELKPNLSAAFSVTPDYFESDLLSTAGSAFGLEPSFRQSAYFRFHNRSEDVKGLYFVGANTHPGAGVPGVINSAKILRHLVPQAGG